MFSKGVACLVMTEEIETDHRLIHHLTGQLSMFACNRDYLFIGPMVKRILILSEFVSQIVLEYL